MQVPAHMLATHRFKNAVSVSPMGGLLSPLYASPQESPGWKSNEEYFARNKALLSRVLQQKTSEVNDRARNIARDYVNRRNMWLKKLRRIEGAAGPSTAVVTTIAKLGAKSAGGGEGKKKKSEKKKKTAPTHRYPSRSHAVADATDFVASEFEKRG